MVVPPPPPPPSLIANAFRSLSLLALSVAFGRPATTNTRALPRTRDGHSPLHIFVDAVAAVAAVAAAAAAAVATMMAVDCRDRTVG